MGPMRNRVTPLGDLVATELRGAWTGNRGILHRGHDVVRHHAGTRWIVCALRYKDWQLPQWAPGHFTVLFFHDEAVALAAGHRPCAQCRREAYDAFRTAWAGGRGVMVPSAGELDRTLHGERLVPGTHRRRLYNAPWSVLPTGAFAVVDDELVLVAGDAVVPWTPRGYGTPRARPGEGRVNVLTPPSTVAALRAGYRPQLDPAATSTQAPIGE